MVASEMLGRIVEDVKRKRELEGLDEGTVRGKVTRALRVMPKLREKLEQQPFREVARSARYKELRRTVREELREIYGVFDLDAKRQRAALVANVAPPVDDATVESLLSFHQSSRERLPHYHHIYEELFRITGTPESILDLGCGANPYSYPWLGCTPAYFAVDLPGQQLTLIQDFFARLGVEGRVEGVDLVDESERVRHFGHIDVIFCFKLLDSLETVRRGSAARLLEHVDAEWLIVSFPTMSIGGGKHIRKERRTWFEKLIAKRGWKATTFEVPNEIFYIVKND